MAPAPSYLDVYSGKYIFLTINFRSRWVWDGKESKLQKGTSKPIAGSEETGLLKSSHFGCFKQSQKKEILIYLLGKECYISAALFQVMEMYYFSSLPERNEPELLSGTIVFDLLVFGAALSSFLQYSAISGQLGEKWQRSDVAWLIGNNSREKRLKGCCLITSLGSQVVSSLNLDFSSPTLLYKYIGKNGSVLCAL